MIKIIIIFFLLHLALIARENPFFPSAGEKDMPYTSNETRTKEPLKRAAITLPAEARILQKVTIEYTNLDGSLKSKSIELDNYVDWHLPIFVSQNYIDASAEKEATKKIPSKNKSEYKNIASIKDLKFFSSGKNLKIVTKDAMSRNFLLSDPHRIVIDFKKEIDIRSYAKNLPESIFKSIRIGNHSGYYRVVLELDGQYRYAINKITDGYLIELR